jgi:hypothetical protein
MRDEVEPGDGWLMCSAGSEGDAVNVWSFKVMPSNMCCGAMFGSCCILGVSVREIGECDRSEAPEEALCETLRCELFPKGGVPVSDSDAGKPFVSNGGWRKPSSAPRFYQLRVKEPIHLLLLAMCC